MKTKVLISAIIQSLLFLSVISGTIYSKEHLQSFDPIGTKIIYVDDDFDDDPINHRWNTIQEGLNDANNGDTIFVYRGAYFENILIEKSVTLIGEEKDATIIDGQQQNDCVKILYDYVNITGFTIQNSGVGIYPDLDAGIDLQAYNITITQCIVTQNNYGVLIKKSYNLLEKCIVHNNIRGIRVVGNKNTITDCEFSRNIIGVEGEQVKQNVFSHLLIHDNDDGVHIINSQENYINDSTLTHNNRNGIILEWTCFDNRISNCNISSNGEDGIHVYASTDRNIISECLIANNGEDGIEFFDTSNNNLVLFSNITGNNQRAIYDHWMYTPPFNRIHFCNIYNNGFGIYGEFCQPNAIHNWWGSPDGPSGAGGGKGDKITQNVIYKPWFQEPVGKNNPPSIELIFPKEGDIIGRTIIITGRSNDLDGKETIGQVEIKIDERNWIIANGTSIWEYPCNIPLENGPHTIFARAYDYVDYSQVSYRNIIVDIDNPTITLIYPSVGEKIKDSVKIQWLAYDNQDENLSITIMYTNSTIWHEILSSGENTGEYFWDTTSISNGQYILNISAADNAGNKAYNISGWFILDKTLPSLQIIQPKAGYIYIANKKIVPTFTGKTVIFGKISLSLIIDAPLGIEKIEFYLNDLLTEVLYTPPYEWTLNMPLLGKHIVNIVLFDQKNRSINDSIEASFFIL